MFYVQRQIMIVDVLVALFARKGRWKLQKQHTKQENIVAQWEFTLSPPYHTRHMDPESIINVW